MKSKSNWVHYISAGGIAWAALGLSATSFAGLIAGTIRVNGYGEASAETELVRIGVRVFSRCNETSVAAKNANAVLANQVLDVLKKYVPEGSENDQTFRIIANPGANVRQTETEGYGEHMKIICERKWRASESISATIKKIEDVPALQDELLQAVDAASGSGSGVTQTWAEIDAPVFDLLPATWEKIKSEAQANALADARKKVAVFDSACSFTGMRLVRVSDPKFTETRVYDKVAYARISTDTPIMPDALQVSSTWDFVWAYDKASTSGGPQCLH